MLNLRLREEFLGKRLKGTAIELANREGSGATQVAASEFLEITYPTHDVLKGIEAIGPDQGRPIVVIGERGSGKSHLLATLHHAATSPDETSSWLKGWADKLGEPAIGQIRLRTGMLVVGTSMHQQEYKFLWDVLFTNHPKGTYIRGKWEGMGENKTEIPPRSLIEELLSSQPVLLLLDEFQTWYDGLTSTKQYPWRQWAFNFIQMLSELASERPDLLVLVVSVRDGSSDAYQQIHRNNPVHIDFKAGGSAERVQQDRRRMLLHRLFENRMQVPPSQIEELISPHVDEYLRLMEINPSERQKARDLFAEAWPFAPHLLQLLEDQVLVATNAQESRDLIRILASLFKSRGESVPLITAADFRLDDEVSGIGALLDSIANQRHSDLRERALRNMLAVQEAVPRHASVTPHLDDIMASLWLRSIAVGNMAGGERSMLQVDTTRTQKIDDNLFQSELATIVENSFNPVAWFVVKQELAKVDIEEVKRLLADIEAEVKPQIMPYYCCDGPKGEKGKWTHKPSGRVEGPDFDPLSIPREARKDYSYEGPEIIYTFWAKHGPCQVTGCGHCTPIMASTVMAIKTLTVKSWDYSCTQCGKKFDLEDSEARMAPDAPLYVAPEEKVYATLGPDNRVKCPHCKSECAVNPAYLGKGLSKKIELSLLVHPQWLAGSPGVDEEGRPYGGSAQDDAESTARWNAERAKSIRLLEVRGKLPDEVEDPETGLRFAPEKGTVPKKSHYACGACGTVQDVLGSIKPTGKTGAMAGYAIQGYAPKLAERSDAYNGRFFSPFDKTIARQYDAAFAEWSERKETDLEPYWPRSEVPYGFMTSMNNGGIPNHGYTHWWTMFNPRQLLVQSLLLKTITTAGRYAWETREYILGAFQQYLRNQNLFTLWNIGADKLEPMFANNNYHPKATVIENSVYANIGRGNWSSCIEGIIEGRDWTENPWDTISVEMLKRAYPALASQTGAKGEKVYPHDATMDAEVFQGSSTDLNQIASGSYDLVITDPPFGGLLHYSELSDFFHVWLQLVLKDKYPTIFGSEFTPKSLEVVANRAREPEDPDGFYQRLLTQCWREAHRILKPAGILAFTFHHSEDAPWVAVLESLFNAGFYLEATYPIRSDETKGEGAKPGTFGSQTIEYDIIHVCRKRTDEPTPVSWGRMRREVLSDVRNLQAMLENHAKAGLPLADLQVIRRGKALEYYSRHYGKVYVDLDRIIDVREALVGINQLIDEDSNKSKDPPPANAEPMTRQFLRIFDGVTEVARDQIQKFLKGSGIAPDEFVERGWCEEKDKIFRFVQPLAYAQTWRGEKRSKLSADLDQALFLVGACVEGSGINAGDTLRNGNFKPHIALKNLLEYLSRHLTDPVAKNAASRAHTILKTWVDSNRPQKGQMDLFGEDEA